jgi:hypothetical protein
VKCYRKLKPISVEAHLFGGVKVKRGELKKGEDKKYRSELRRAEIEMLEVSVKDL